MTLAKSPLILLVNPSLGTKRYEEEDRLRSYLSLGTLASALISKAFMKRFFVRLGKGEFIYNAEDDYPDFDVRVLNLSLRPNNLSIREYFSAFSEQFSGPPLMVCMTATSAQLDEAEEVALSAKKFAPTATRIIGGAHVSVSAEEYLKDSVYQLACIGEGVETLAEIALLTAKVENPDFSSVDGIAFKDNKDQVRLNPLRNPLLHLDEYPFPSDSLDFFTESTKCGEENKSPIIYILSGYGCPHDCIFCAQRAIHGRKIRERSAENIFKEIEKLFFKGFRKFAFVQETFLNRRERVEALCRLLKDAGMEIEWTIEARADQLDYDYLKLMKAVGLQFVQIGVESGDRALLKTLGKNIHLDQMIEVKKWCYDLKIETAFYMLVGLPGQGWQSVFRSALFLMDHPPYNRVTKHASVSIAVPYPATKMWEEQTVRLIEMENHRKSWPDRNPDVTANDEGEFLGKNCTETDDMSSEEILEAWIYLDDFSHFLLHAIHGDPRNSEDRRRSLDYANRMFYMIERRTIRDLVICAQPDLTPETRRTAYLEIEEFDANYEKHFKDVTAFTETTSDIFIRFLGAVRFLNGFQTMKWLSVDNRIKWMKICAIVWHIKGRGLDAFRFEKDHRDVGLEIEKRLQKVEESRLNQYLVQIDTGFSMELFPDFAFSLQHISAFGFTHFTAKSNLIEITLQS